MRNLSLIPGKMYAARRTILLRSLPDAFLDRNGQVITEIKKENLVMFIDIHPETKLLANKSSASRDIEYYFLKVVYNDQVGYIACDAAVGKQPLFQRWLADLDSDEYDETIIWTIPNKE